MKRVITLFLCLAFALSALTACSVSVNTTNSDSDSADTAESSDSAEFKVGETWTVDGQWELTVTGFEETEERNEYAEKKPAAVYLVSFNYKNIGYVDADGIMDGLYFMLDDTIVDCAGEMGYSYPGNVDSYPEETPVGATCKAQVCIGVDNAGTPIKLIVSNYDGNDNKQKATFIIE